MNAQEALTIAIGKLTMEQRLHAYVQMNCFQWPDDLRELQPEDWDSLTEKERYNHPSARAAWVALHERTGRFERSRQWWLEKLNRTDEQHREWFEKNRPMIEATCCLSEPPLPPNPKS